MFEARKRAGIFVTDLVTLCFDKTGDLAPWKVAKYPALLKGKRHNIVSLGQYLQTGAPLIKPMFLRRIIRDNAIWLPDLRYAEDLDFIIQVFHAGLGLEIVSDSFYFYRLTPGWLSSTLSPDVLKVY